MFFQREDDVEDKSSIRYNLNVTENIFYFLCSYCSLDKKGREAVMDLIEQEEERCMKEREASEYDMEEDLWQAEAELGYEFY